MNARRGFTLLEVILVMVIVVMLAALAIPSIEAMYADMRVQAAADHLRARFAEARTRAIDEGRPYRFAIRPHEGDYRIAPDSPEHWGEGASPAAEDDKAPAPLIVEDRLPEDIVFQFSEHSGMTESGAWTHLVTFNPDGSCSDDCSIRLDREGTRSIEIQIRALTGSVTSRSLAPEAGP